MSDKNAEKSVRTSTSHNSTNELQAVQFQFSAKNVVMDVPGFGCITLDSIKAQCTCNITSEVLMKFTTDYFSKNDFFKNLFPYLKRIGDNELEVTEL